jgi:phospholipid/cholesterol/gamma-HCH transport system substrate-binding protein
MWYLRSVSRYASYQILTEDPVSGLAVDAPIEFHGVEVGKVKTIKLVNPHSVAILVNIDKSAPVTSASVATITSRGLATRDNLSIACSRLPKRWRQIAGS